MRDESPVAPFSTQYPRELQRAERKWLGQAPQRKDPGGTEYTPHVGVALSGGGIRSATFALGVFEALAKLKLIGRIDYLSTVSGGGYFGSFLGRLFSRAYIETPADVESVLGGDTPQTRNADLHHARTQVRGWLRENGRFLAPRGAGDLLIAGASMLRSLFTVHVLIALVAVLVLTAMQAPRVWVTLCEPALSGRAAWAVTETHALISALSLNRFGLWWSPWLLVSIAVGLAALPVGAAYWLAGRRKEELRRVLALVVTFAVSLVFWLLKPVSPGATHSHIGAAGLGLFVLSSGTTIAYVAALGLARLRVKGTPAWQLPVELMSLVRELAAMPWLSMGTRTTAYSAPGNRAGATTHATDQLFKEAACRSILSTWLKTCLVLLGAILLITIVDTFGQTIYKHWALRTLAPWFAAITAAAIAGSKAIRSLIELAGLFGKGARPKLPASILATLVAAVLVVLLLTSASVVAHAFRWDFARPGTISGWPANAFWLIGLTVLAAAFGWTFSFVNDSTEQPIYRQRITRAYLGASNAHRWTDGGAAITEPISDDDVQLPDYYRESMKRGAPIHLINVTINETVGGKSQVQQQDRKGLGMAIGPGGISAGVRHHLIGMPATLDEPGPTPDARPLDGFRVFALERDKRPEALPLGAWIGISGAAFSTGMGANTSIGLSLLAGLANVRLGYWWDSRVNPDDRLNATPERMTAGQFARRAFEIAFRSQAYLLYEWIARFPGTSRRWWNLSDGGHFENMGAYELIRRRLPLIIIVDAEQDDAYTFGGLSNLVRKARIDFGAEITFLSDDAIAPSEPKRPSVLAGSARYRGLFGSLDRLRREKIKDAPDDGLKVSGAHAAIAKVTWTGSAQESWLVYVKATITGDEPADVIEYARSHPAFPHEPTSDQFFDEAQWESYRALGEHIASQVFNSPAPDGSKWTMGGMFGAQSRD